MAGPLPGVPTNFLVQPGNGSVYLNWTPVPSATSYNVLRSTDSINFTTIASPSASNYSDSSGTIGTLYYYEVQAVNVNGTGNATAFVAATPVNYGQTTLGAIRLAAQQRADMVNSNFVSTQEWNDYISKSYKQLYDILVQVYGDEYYVATPFQFNADGRYPALYALPNNFYKLLGVDLAIGPTNNQGWLTLKKFSFITRNRYIYGNTPVSFLGVMNLRYRLVGSNIEFVPNPINNQTVQLWFIPRPAVLLADSDILDGISGWEEYIIVDAAIKAMQKEESDVTVLLAQKADLRKSIESAASNRDAGEPECATDIRRLDGSYFGDVWGNESCGGW